MLIETADVVGLVNTYLCTRRDTAITTYSNRIRSLATLDKEMLCALDARARREFFFESL